MSRKSKTEKKIRKVSSTVDRYGKILHIFEATYRQNFYHVYAKNYQDYRRTILKQLGVPHDDGEDHKSGGRFEVYTREGMDVGFIWSTNGEMGMLAHECFHATHWLLRSRGIQLSDELGEVYAYMIQFLMNSILTGKV